MSYLSPLTPEEEKEIENIVRKTARSYARKCYWADEKELRQVANVGVQVARRKYARTEGRPEPYFQIAVKRAISNFLIKASSPVSSSWHDRFNMIGIKRVGEDSPEAIAAFDGEDEGWADRVLEDKRMRVRILARLLEVAGPDGRAGLEVLLAEKKRTGRVSRALQESIDLVKARIACDAELHAFWAERESHDEEPPEQVWQRAIRERRIESALKRGTK